MGAEFLEELFKDCGTISIPSFFDKRGSFIKPLHPSVFPSGIRPFEVRESFISQSARGVLRGMHFQVPPFEQWKLVCCLAGEVLDVVVDLRQGKGGYGKAAGVVLRGAQSGGPIQAMLVPPGVAHGFYTLSENAMLAYYVSCEYQREHDLGILWSSIDFSWPTDAPVLSDRDASFESFSNFVTPFKVSEVG
jgi:dTDP-4-dehydrorhamnose 3,5-epimerase